MSVSLWESLKRLLDPSATAMTKTFSMGDRGEQPAVEVNGPERLADAQLRTKGVMTHIDNLLDAEPKGKDAVEKAGDLSDDLDENMARLKDLFHTPDNVDLKVRELTIATQPPTRAVVCFMEGLSDKTTINNNVLQPLMLLTHLDHHVGGEGESGQTRFSVDTVIKRLLPGHEVSEKYDLGSITEALLAGDTLLFFAGQKVALDIDTKGYPMRSVSYPQWERGIQGPQDAFTESFRVNATLVRRRLKDPRLVTEIMTVGEISKNYVAIMHIDGLVSPKLVAEVKRRIKTIKVDALDATSVLQQFIEDSPQSLMPGALLTERPDRVASYLTEGHVAILADNSADALVCPITFWSLFQSADDYYLRWPFGTLLRYLRLGALITVLFVPALYISIVNYHQEMIPTQLMLFIAASREHIPMPSVVELVLLDLSFELMREAGTRIPSIIGPTIGFVASLVLGQAAVSANVVSPLMILIVASVGLASMAIPNYMMNYGIRSFRFVLLAASTVLGFFGLAAGTFLSVVYLAGLRSFGVPYLSPVAPRRKSSPDIQNRAPMYEMELRPGYLHPLDIRRQKEVIRAWDPTIEKPDESADQDGGSQ